MRLKDLATSVSDTFHLERKHIAIKDGFNVRFDMGANDEWKQFVQSILANGVIKPITGFKDENDKFIVTDGHRRIAGLDEALAILDADLTDAKGNRVKAAEIREKIAAISIIPCTSEPKGTTDLDRNFSIAISNTGKPLNLLETALLFERLMRDFQVSESEILRRTGISRTAFDNCMILVNAPEVHEFVKKGKITSSLALEVCRKVKDKEERVAIIKQGIETAKAAGKEHATAKHLNSDVRSEVAPSKKGQRNGAGSSANGSNGNGSHATNGNGNGHAASTPAPGTRSLESVLTSRSNTLLSSVLEPKWKIDGAITLALNRESRTWFYNVAATQGKDTLLNLPWTYGLFRDGVTAPVPDATTRGFDEKDEALHQAWRAIRHWLSRYPTRHTQQALKAVDAVVAKLNGHDESETGESPAPRFTMHANLGTSAGNGKSDKTGADSSTHDAPEPPSEEETQISADLGDQSPADSDAAFDGILRVLGDVKEIGGVTKKNERFATLKFIGEYLEGQHTHNQLKAFVLYGSPETRDLTVSKR